MRHPAREVLFQNEICSCLGDDESCQVPARSFVLAKLYARVERNERALISLILEGRVEVCRVSEPQARIMSTV